MSEKKNTFDLDTTDLEKLMGDAKEDFIKAAIEEIPETFSQEDTLQINSNDERMNYLFVKKEDVENKIFKPKEYLDKERIDYDVIVKKGEPETEDSLGTFDETRPASFFTNAFTSKAPPGIFNPLPKLPLLRFLLIFIIIFRFNSSPGRPNPSCSSSFNLPSSIETFSFLISPKLAIRPGFTNPLLSIASFA